MELKLSSDLYLGLQELKHFRASLRDQGYVKIFQNSVVTYGVVKKPSDLNFTNLQVYESSINKVGVRAGIAIDQEMNIIEVKQDIADLLEIPSDNVLRYVVIKYAETVIEEGTVNIQSDGSIVGTDTKFIDRLRGLPNRPSKIKFESTVNTQEYVIQAVQSDTLASLNVQAADIVVENNVKYSVVGTFTPSVVIPTANKFPFISDGYEIELRDSDVLADGEYILAQVQYDGVNLSIFDKRLNNKFSFVDESVEAITDENNVVGVEQITFDNICSTMNENLVKVGWGIESTDGNWSVNSATQELTVSSGKGGAWLGTAAFQDGFFDNWYAVFEATGQVVKIQQSEKIGTAISLKLDFANSYPSTGNVSITPNADFIEITILNATDPNADKRLTFASISRYAIIPMLAGTESIIQYRHLSRSQMSLGRTINNGSYIQENSFDDKGTQTAQGTKNYFDGKILPIKSVNNLYDRITCNWIRMWSGSIDTIPEGYFLCDGENGTIDLRGQFVVGVDPSDAASKFKTVGEKGGATEVTLDTSQIPAHSHDGEAKGFDHSHDYKDRYYPESSLTQPLGEGFGAESQIGGIQGSNDTDEDNVLIIYKEATTEGSGELTGSITTNNTGGGQPHENTPPYYTLCFVMRPCSVNDPQNEVQGNLLDLSSLLHFKNDAAAATGGIQVGQFYLAAKLNTLGLAHGTAKRREV